MINRASPRIRFPVLTRALTMSAGDSLPDCTLTLMGTGTSAGVPILTCSCEVCTSDDPRNTRTRSGVLVEAPEGKFVIDTSPDLRTQLLAQRIDLVQAALFTHGHADHIYGLDDLRFFGHILDTDIPLHAEPVVEDHLRTVFPYAFDDRPAAHKWGKPRFRFESITDSEPIDVLGLSVRPIRLLHGRLPILGFRLGGSEGRGGVAFCTDVSEIPEESWPLLENLDVLILGALQPEPHPTHFNVEQAVDVAERLAAKRTYFTHISHKLEHTATTESLPETIDLAHDGLRIPFASR